MKICLIRVIRVRFKPNLRTWKIIKTKEDMKINKFMFGILIFVIIFSIFTLIILPIDIIGNKLFPFPNKVTFGNDSNISLDYPWGKVTNMTVFVEIENISTEEREKYNNRVNKALKWWENDKTHNLSYDVNFTILENLQNANIIIKYVESVSSNPSDRGYTHVNSTGKYDSKGENVCDTYWPPYKKCIIEIRSNLSTEQDFFVVKHEVGHALGLMHSFNLKDFFIAYTTYFGNDPVYSEIMFDFSVYNVTTEKLFNLYKNFKWKQK